MKQHLNRLAWLALCLSLNATAASTNLNYTAAQINTALGVGLANTNLQAEVFSAGVADVGFVNAVITNAFTETTFTTLDLSSIVGTNAAVVGLHVHANAAATLMVRPGGTTNNVDTTTATGVVLASGQDAFMTLSTDAAGTIEADTTASVDMSLLWFIRRHEWE